MVWASALTALWLCFVWLVCSSFLASCIGADGENCQLSGCGSCGWCSLSRLVWVWFRCAVCPCGGFAVGIVRPDCLLWWLLWGLFPSPLVCISGRAVVGSVVWDCGLNWRVSCLGASVLPLVVPSVCSGRSSVVLTVFCMMVGAVSWGRVVSWSVVRLPLVWVGGVLSGLHPLPFLLSVCLVWVCLLWVRLVWVCGRCGRCGVVTYCTKHKDNTFAPVFEL